jgi:nitrogen fixation NifU-like protein
MYSNIVMDHFKNPRNVGGIQGAVGVGEVKNPICGDMMEITIKVANDRIKDVKFLTFGCGAAIAVSSMVTDIAKKKPG